MSIIISFQFGQSESGIVVTRNALLDKDIIVVY